MATTDIRKQSIQEYYDEMSQVGVKAVKSFRIAYISTLLVGAYWVAVRGGADPQSTLPWVTGAILLVAGVEIAELRALKKLTSLNISFGSDQD